MVSVAVAGRVPHAGVDVVVKDVEAWVPFSQTDCPNVSQRFDLRIGRGYGLSGAPDDRYGRICCGRCCCRGADLDDAAPVDLFSGQRRAGAR